MAGGSLSHPKQLQQSSIPTTFFFEEAVGKVPKLAPNKYNYRYLMTNHIDIVLTTLKACTHLQAFISVKSIVYFTAVTLRLEGTAV